LCDISRLRRFPSFATLVTLEVVAEMVDMNTISQRLTGIERNGDIPFCCDCHPAGDPGPSVEIDNCHPAGDVYTSVDAFCQHAEVCYLTENVLLKMSLHPSRTSNHTKTTISASIRSSSNVIDNET